MRDDRDHAGADIVLHQKSPVVRLWTTGPSRREGKKVSAPTRITTPISRITKVGLSVRIVPRPAGETRLPARAPATARTKRIGRKRAITITPPPSRSAKLIP